MQDKIINLAPTGMVPTLKMNPNVPLEPKSVARDVAQCAAMGISLVHLHARDSQGKPTYRKEAYARLIGEVRAQCPDIVICVSLSGRNFPDVENRAEVLSLTGDLKPDMGSLTLSSLNFQQDASLNAPNTIRDLARRMSEKGIKPELEVFDSGMLNFAHYLIHKGEIHPPFYFNFILGNIAGAQATPSHLGMLLAELPDNALWCGGGIGRAQLPMNTMGLMYGHGLRTGLEDNLWMDHGKTLPASNFSLIQRINDLMTSLDYRAISPTELRRRLELRKI